MKKIVVVLLLVCLMSMSFVGCADKNTPVDTTSAESPPSESTGGKEEQPVEPPYYLDQLPSERFDNETFMVITSHQSNQPIESEEGFTDHVNEALNRRDYEIEERYGVNIDYLVCLSDADVVTYVSAAEMAGDADYNLVIMRPNKAKELITGDCLYDIASLENVDLTKEWWSQTLLESTQLNGKVYMAAGPIAQYYFHAPFAMAYNKQLIADNNLDDPSALALEGNWTLDAYCRLAAEMPKNLDGNNVMDENDLYAITTGTTSLTAMYISCGMKLSELGENGNLSINLISDSSVTVVDRLTEIFTSGSAYIKSTQDSISLFKNNNVLFFQEMMGYFIDNLRDMEEDYGIIPLPKWDEGQEDYHSLCKPSSCYGLFVPKLAGDDPKTGLILEAMAFLSNEYVKVAKYDTVVKFGVSRDETTTQLLDIIYGSSYFDFNAIYDVGGSATLVNNIIRGRQTGFVSSYQSIEQVIQSELSALLTAIGSDE